jgi:hypothetical protein
VIVNAIPFPRQPLPAATNDPAYASACAVLAAEKIQQAHTLLGDQIGAIYGLRRALTQHEADAVSRLRGAASLLEGAASLLAPLTVEKPR